LSGILVKKNFAYHLLAPEDLVKYTDMTMSSIEQKLSVPFAGGYAELKAALAGLAFEPVDEQAILLLGAIKVGLKKGFAVLEWSSSPAADMYADTIIAILLKQSISEEEMKQLRVTARPDDPEDMKPKRKHPLPGKTISAQAKELLFTNFLIDSIRDMFDLEEEQLNLDARTVPVVAKESTDNVKMEAEEEHKMVSFTLP